MLIGYTIGLPKSLLIIHEAFQEQRVAQRVERVDGHDMDTNALLKKHTETLKAICNIRVNYFNDDFKNREQENKVSEYLEGLKDVFSQLKIETKEAASAAAEPQPGRSGYIRRKKNI